MHRSLLSLFTDAESSDRSRLAINNISNDVELKTSSVFINFILHFVVWTKKLYRKGEDLLIFRLVDPESLFLSLLLSCFIFVIFISLFLDLFLSFMFRTDGIFSLLAPQYTSEHWPDSFSSVDSPRRLQHQPR